MSEQGENPGEDEPAPARRLAYLYDTPLPNVFSATTQILTTGRAMAERGDSFLFLTGQRREDGAATLDRLGIAPHPRLRIASALPPLPRTPGLRTAFAGAILAAARPWGGADALLSRGESGFAAAAALGLRRGPPFIYELHRLAGVAEAERRLGRRLEEGEPLPRSAAAVARREVAAIARADGLIFLTEDLAETVLSRIEGPVPFVVAPSGVAVPDPAPAPTKDVDVVFIGKIERRKGVDLALRAIAAVPGATIRVLGDGPWLGEARRLAVALGIAERVDFAGRIPHSEAPLALARARIGLCPLPAGVDHVAERFTSPLKLLEMMAVGLPVVATDLPSVRAICADGREALLADPVAPEAIAQRICALRADPELAARLGAAGRRRARDFDWRSRADRIASLVNAVLDRRQRRA